MLPACLAIVLDTEATSLISETENYEGRPLDQWLPTLMNDAKAEIETNLTTFKDDLNTWNSKARTETQDSVREVDVKIVAEY